MSTDTTTTIVTYYVTRDSLKARTDEDIAMAHASIGRFDTLAAAQEALKAYMLHEVEWLVGREYRSTASLTRAAEILAAAEEVATLVPAEDETWSAASLTPAGLSFAIIRSAKGA